MRTVGDAASRRRVLVVVACVLGFFAGGWFVGTASSSPRETFVRMPDTNDVPSGIPVRSVAGLAVDMDLTAADERLVLFVLSPECPYCKQNMRWWREIADGFAEAGTSPIRVLSSGATREASEFLAAHGLEASLWTIDEAALDVLGLPAVPATVLVDPRAGVVHRWIGVIDDRLRDDLVEWLRGGSIPPS